MLRRSIHTNVRRLVIVVCRRTAALFRRPRGVELFCDGCNRLVFIILYEKVVRSVEMSFDVVVRVGFSTLTSVLFSARKGFWPASLLGLSSSAK